MEDAGEGVEMEVEVVGDFGFRPFAVLESADDDRVGLAIAECEI